MLAIMSGGSGRCQFNAATVQQGSIKDQARVR